MNTKLQSQYSVITAALTNASLSPTAHADRTVPTPTPGADPVNTSVASGSSEPSGSSQDTLPDSGYSQSQELFSPNEEEREVADHRLVAE